jgi:hypothetical protein
MGALVPRHPIAEPTCRSQRHALRIEQCWYWSSPYVRKLQTFSSGHSPAQVVIVERHPADMGFCHASRHSQYIAHLNVFIKQSHGPHRNSRVVEKATA